MKPSKFFLFLIVLAGALAPAFSQNAVELYQKGREAFANRNWSLSTGLLQQLVTQFPDDPRADDASYLIGVSHYYLEDYEESRRIFARFRRLYPESGYNSRLSYWIGASAMSQGDFEAAASEFGLQTQYPQETNFYTRSYLYQGVSFEKLEDFDSALTSYYNLVEADASQELLSQAWYRIGVLELEKEQFSKSLEGFTRVLDLRDPEYSRDALFQLGEVYFQMENWDNAEERLSRFVGLYPDSRFRELALFRLGTLATRSGDWNRGIAFYDLMLEEFPRGPYSLLSLELVGWHYMELKRWSEAVGAFQALLSRDIDDTLAQQAWYNVGTGFYFLENWPKSEEAFAFSSEGPLVDIATESLYFQARVQTAQDKNREAAQTLVNFIDKAPGHPWAYSSAKVAASLAMKTEDPIFQIERLEYLIEFYSNDSDLSRWYYQIGEIYLDLKDYESSLGAYQSALGANPIKEDEGEILYKIGYIYSQRAEYIRAEAYFYRIVQSNYARELYMRALLARGISFFNAGDFDTAEGIFRRVLREDPLGVHVGMAGYYQAELLQRLGRLEASARAFLQYAPSMERSLRLESLSRAGDLALEVGEYSLGLESWFAFQSDPALSSEESARSFLGIGQIYQAREEWSESLTVLENALEFSNSGWEDEILFRLVMAKYKSSQPDWDQDLQRLGDPTLSGEVLLRIAMEESSKDTGDPKSFLMDLLRDYPDSPAAPVGALRLAQLILQEGDQVASLELYTEYFKRYGEVTGAAAAARSMASQVLSFTQRDALDQFLDTVYEFELSEETRQELLIFDALVSMETNPAKSENALREIIETGVNPQLKARAVLELGDFFRRNQQLDDAVEAYRLLIASGLEGFQARAELGLGQVYLDLEEYQLALDSLILAQGRIDQDSPYFPMVLYYGVVASANVGDSGIEGDFRDSLIRLFPDNYWTNKLLREDAFERVQNESNF